MAARRSSGYYPLRWDEYGLEAHGRSLSTHPSLSNLSSHQFAAGSPYRPRGGAQAVQTRYQSAPTNRSNPIQLSPTHSSSFYPIQHPVPPSNISPAFRPPKPASGSPAANPRGVNVAAAPFLPSSSYGPSSSQGYEHTTSFMPPQLQHRIYLPNVRPHPTPNFHPPPSVLAEQAQARRASPPAFPPLPGTSGTPQQGGKSGVPAGPSLASIVTKAVLSPTSALVIQGTPLVSSSGGTRPSPPGGLKSPVPIPGLPNSNAGSSQASVSALGQRMTFGPPPQARGDELSPFSPPAPPGPWAPSLSHGSGYGGGSSTGVSMARTGTPPVGWGVGVAFGGRDSLFALGKGEGASRKSTGDSA